MDAPEEPAFAEEPVEGPHRVQLERDMRRSAKLLPGPWYYNVLAWIHRGLRPANYVEIGVNRGLSLIQAVKGTPIIGIDPSPRVEYDVPDATIYEMTSDEFFAGHDLTGLLGGPVELAFIDGLHLFEQVLRDFVNLERHASPETVILLHDCLPLNQRTATRDRAAYFYSGDVWKAALALRRERPELEMVVVPAPPTGLCLVRGLDPDGREFEDRLPEVVAGYMDRSFRYYVAHRDEMPEKIANDEHAVRDWLRAARAG